MTEFLFIRHALPSAGPLDPGLAPEGVEQARALARWLEPDGLDALACSPLLRARETAALIGEPFGLQAKVIDDLREWQRPVPPESYIPLEDMTADDPRSRAIVEGRYEDFVPDLDVAGFRAQSDRVIPQLLEFYPGAERVAVAAHGGLINAVVGGLLGIERIFWFNIRYTSVSRILLKPGGRVVVDSLNETPHLVGRRH